MKRLTVSVLTIAIAAVGCIAQAGENGKERSSGGVESKSINESKKMGTVAITTEEFLTKVADYRSTPAEWKYLGDKPALVDFYASWCGPCKMIAPILEDLAAEYGDQIVIYKVNTEKEPELAAAFGIRSIPTLLYIPLNGQPQMSQGAMSKQQFREAIDKILLGK